MTSDREKLYTALSGWIRNIETGSFNGMDKSQMFKLLLSGDKDMKRIFNDLPQLTMEQQMFVADLRTLMTKVINGDEL